MNNRDESEIVNPKKKVLLVDDHAVVRTGLATLINEEHDLLACGEAENERSAFEAVRLLRPDVAVVDWSLKNRDSSELVATLHQDYPDLPVLVLSIHDEIFYAERAVLAGARGYVMKQEATEKIVEAIKRVAAGQSYLSERAMQAISGEARMRIATSGISRPKNGRPVPVPSTDATASHSSLPISRSGTETVISIIIPVYNSEKSIDRLCALLIELLTHSYRLQIVLVDDGSGDGSATVCKTLHERYPEVVDCVFLSRNFGEHNAVMAGLNCAEGDYCVIMDDDFQNPPSEVCKLIQEIKKGYDVVYTRYESKQHTLFRNLGSRFHNWLATHALSKPADLYLSSFKIISRFVVSEVVHYTGPDPYLDAIILRTTRRIGTVTVRHEARKEGKSGYNLKKLFSLWGNMFVAFSLYPLRLMAILGVIMSVGGAFYFLYTLLASVVPSIPDPDPYEKLNAAMWLSRGLAMFAIGVVGEYVGRIYMHLARDPQFIIRNILRHRPRI